MKSSILRVLILGTLLISLFVVTPAFADTSEDSEPPKEELSHVIFLPLVSMEAQSQSLDIMVKIGRDDDVMEKLTNSGMPSEVVNNIVSSMTSRISSASVQAPEFDYFNTSLYCSPGKDGYAIFGVSEGFFFSQFTTTGSGSYSADVCASNEAPCWIAHYHAVLGNIYVISHLAQTAGYLQDDPDAWCTAF